MKTVLEMTKAPVTPVAKKATDIFSFVVVIYIEKPVMIYFP